MFGIRIKGTKQSGGGGSHLTFDLRDILAAVGEPVLSSRWRCRGLWYLTVRDGEFNEFREERRKFTGEEMMRFAGSITQTIDGRFEARSGGAAKRSWLVILAVDSSWFEVWSPKREVLERVRARFENVSDISAAAA